MSNNDNLANVQSTDELHIKLSAKNINISNFDLTCCIIIMFFFLFYTCISYCYQFTSKKFKMPIRILNF